MTFFPNRVLSEETPLRKASLAISASEDQEHDLQSLFTAAYHHTAPDDTKSRFVISALASQQSLPTVESEPYVKRRPSQPIAKTRPDELSAAGRTERSHSEPHVPSPSSFPPQHDSSPSSRTLTASASASRTIRSQSSTRWTSSSGTAHSTTTAASSGLAPPSRIRITGGPASTSALSSSKEGSSGSTAYSAKRPKRRKCRSGEHDFEQKFGVSFCFHLPSYPYRV